MLLSRDCRPAAVVLCAPAPSMYRLRTVTGCMISRQYSTRNLEPNLGVLPVDGETVIPSLEQLPAVTRWFGKVTPVTLRIESKAAELRTEHHTLVHEDIVVTCLVLEMVRLAAVEEIYPAPSSHRPWLASAGGVVCRGDRWSTV